MEQASTERPALSQRIWQTRIRLRDEWTHEHPKERGNPFTQEAMAARVGVTLGAYGAWERAKEPKPARLREIALALGLDEDYFLPSGDLTAATARVEAEADRMSSMADQMEVLLQQLQARLATEAPAPLQPEPGEAPSRP